MGADERDAEIDSGVGELPLAGGGGSLGRGLGGSGGGAGRSRRSGLVVTVGGGGGLRRSLRGVRRAIGQAGPVVVLVPVVLAAIVLAAVRLAAVALVDGVDLAVLDQDVLEPGVLAVGVPEDARLVPAVGQVGRGREALGDGAAVVGVEGAQGVEVALDRTLLALVGALRRDAEGDLLAGGEALDVERDGLGAVGLVDQLVLAAELGGVQLERQRERLEAVVVVVGADEGQAGPLLVLQPGGGNRPRQIDGCGPRAVLLDLAGAGGRGALVPDGPHQAGLVTGGVGAAGAGDGEGRARVGDARVLAVRDEAVLLGGESGGGHGSTSDREGGSSTDGGSEASETHESSKGMIGSGCPSRCGAPLWDQLSLTHNAGTSPQCPRCEMDRCINSHISNNGNKNP